MGIRELFGKRKKKAEFREKAKEALARGKLAPGKVQELEKLRTAHEVDGDDKTMLRATARPPAATRACR